MSTKGLLLVKLQGGNRKTRPGIMLRFSFPHSKFLGNFILRKRFYNELQFYLLCESGFTKFQNIFGISRIFRCSLRLII